MDMKEHHLAVPHELLERTDKTGGSYTLYLVHSSPGELPSKENTVETVSVSRYSRRLRQTSILSIGTPTLPLSSVTRAQNLFALRGLAPRVYDIVLLNPDPDESFWAQVTDYVGDTEPPVTSHTNKSVMGEFCVSTNWGHE